MTSQSLLCFSTRCTLMGLHVSLSLLVWALIYFVGYRLYRSCYIYGSESFTWAMYNLYIFIWKQKIGSRLFQNHEPPGIKHYMATMIEIGFQAVGPTQRTCWLNLAVVCWIYTSDLLLLGRCCCRLRSRWGCWREARWYWSQPGTRWCRSHRPTRQHGHPYNLAQPSPGKEPGNICMF